MMSDLSQAEIDALLAGAGGEESDSSSDGNTFPGDDGGEEILSSMEKDALGEIGNISMGNAATTLSTLLGHKVNITTPSVSVAPMNVIQQHYPLPYLVVEVGYTVGIDGNNVFAIQATILRAIHFRATTAKKFCRQWKRTRSEKSATFPWATRQRLFPRCSVTKFQ